MENLSLASKLIGSSLLAILLMITINSTFNIVKRLFHKPPLNYIIFAATLFIMAYAGFVFLYGQLTNLTTGLIGSITPERIISEFVISIILVISFLATQQLIKGFRYLTSAKGSHENIIRVEKNDTQGLHESIPNMQIRQSLIIWANEKNIQSDLTTDEWLNFITDKYSVFCKQVDETELTAFLRMKKIGIEYPPTESEIIFFVIDDEENIRSVSLEDNVIPDLLQDALSGQDVSGSIQISTKDFVSEDKKALDLINRLAEKHLPSFKK